MGDKMDYRIDDIYEDEFVSECCGGDVLGGHCSICGEPCEGVWNSEREYTNWENSIDYQIDDMVVNL